MGIRFGQRLCQSYGRKQQSTHSNFLEKIKETRFHEVPGKECLVTKATMGQLDTAVVIVIILHPLLKKMYLIWGNKKLLQWQVVLTFRPPQQSYPLWNTSSIFTRMMGLLTCTYCRLTFFLQLCREWNAWALSNWCGIFRVTATYRLHDLHFFSDPAKRKKQ